MNRENMLVIAVGVMSVLAVVAFLVFSPSAGDLGRRDVAGPPTPQPSVIDSHAQQFDVDLGEREAGSQEEQAAATYLLGVLQRNGYLVRLDSVPVGDLVTSTNLIAQPAQISDVGTFVVVGYDGGDPPNGAAIGVFLEVARALSVADPDHSIGFVALGAETRARGDEGHLGSRRLARFLLDEEVDPRILQIVSVGDDVGFAIVGEGVESEGEVGISPDVFAEAGFERVLVAGPPTQVADALMGLLVDAPQ